MAKTKRNQVQEVVEKNKRHRGLNHIAYHVTYHLKKLENEFLSESNHSEAILRYFPVALIASLETYVRGVVKEALDQEDSPFIDNLSSIRNIEFDIETVKAIYHQNRITIGDFVSHIVPVNSIDAISKTLSDLFKIEFRESLKRHWNPDLIQNQKLEPTWVFQKISELYKLRHIFAHELAPDVHMNRDELIEMSKAIQSFIAETNSLLEKPLYGEAPISNADMKRVAGDELDKQEKILTDLIEQFSKILICDEDRDELIKVQNAWELYRETESEFHGNFNARGGTLMGLIKIGVQASLTKERIKYIRDTLASINQS